jgi:hypothetical protein
VPRSSRRRRPPGRGVGQSFLIAIAATVTVVLVAGSLLAIHTQSAGYRNATTSGYVALANKIGQESTLTGAQLSKLMAEAPTLPNARLPMTGILKTARGVLEQGLDAAVLQTSEQAVQATAIASPPPVGNLSEQFTQVMRLRATTTAQLRSTVDRLLGMSPLPIAGSPNAGGPPAPSTLISSPQAAREMSAEGLAFEQADAQFRTVQATVAAQRTPVRLQRSVWVPFPVATAPLGSVALGATASALSSSAALVPYHELVVTAVGLTPPAVPSGGPGSASTSCAAAQSTVPGTTPTVLPPTSTVTALVTVTNCGTVPEAGVIVTLTVTPADATGTAPPPADAAGGRSQATVTVAPGASASPSLSPLPVTSGHLYSVTVKLSVPPSQANLAGSTQSFLVQVSG